MTLTTILVRMYDISKTFVYFCHRSKTFLKTGLFAPVEYEIDIYIMLSVFFYSHKENIAKLPIWISSEKSPSSNCLSYPHMRDYLRLRRGFQ